MTEERLQELIDRVKFSPPAREVVEELLEYIKELEAVKEAWHEPMIGIFDEERR